MSAPPAVGPSGLLRAAARRAGTDPALDDGNDSLTWSQLDERVNAIANTLIARGVTPGDRVTLQAPTGAPFVACYLAVLRAGAVAVPVTPAYTDTEVEHIRSDSAAMMHLDAQRAQDLFAADPHDDDPDRVATSRTSRCCSTRAVRVGGPRARCSARVRSVPTSTSSPPSSHR